MKQIFQIGEVVKIDAARCNDYYPYGVILKTLTNGVYAARYDTLLDAINSDCHLRRKIIVTSKLKSTGHFNNFTILKAL